MEAVVKQRKSVVRRQKKDADKLAKKQGAVTATLQNVPTSTRKMRLVANLIRGQKVNLALNVLKFQAKQGAARLEKLLLAAMADWESKNGRIEEADLFVKEVFVDGGRVLKRLRPAPQGRAHRVRKRSNHVTLIVDSKIALAPKGSATETIVEAAPLETKAKKTVETKAKKPAAAKTTTKKTENK